MSAGSNGGPERSCYPENDAVGEVSVDPSISGGVSAGIYRFDTVASAEKEDRASLVSDKLVETSVSNNMNECRVLEVENEESRLSDARGGTLENPPSSSVLRGYRNGKKTADVRHGNYEYCKKVESAADYDSILTEFDQFASKRAGAVGFGYEIGDMVWGKVKSHPWWPGHIYNEAFASPSVQRSKREGHVLVAFFGDSSYGWFDPEELVPFEENFSEKSKQTSSRAFVKAMEEAVDEISRRQGVGLACCCRNKFNFRPSTMEGYYVVDVGDYEPGSYSSRQISKAREDFQTKEMLYFVQQLALRPMADHHWKMDLVKSKATFLACRRALFEEFDETYAQAFGTVPTRPPRPSAPIALDLSKAPLSGPLVFAEALGKGKLSVKPTKSKEQVEKDKYLFIRRDAPIRMTKKTSSVRAAPFPHPLMLDGSGLSEIPVEFDIKTPTHKTSVSAIKDDQFQSSSDGASVISDIKPSSDVSRKLTEGVQKNAKVPKRHTENATPKKRKIEVSNLAEKKRVKEIRDEGSVNIRKFANSESGVAMEKVTSVLLKVANNQQLDNQNKDDDVETVGLPFLLRDLRALALDPFHGVERNCPSSTPLIFLKYRSLVYRKSLVSFPATGNDTIEPQSTKTLALRGPNDKPSTKLLMKPSARHIDDPTKGGKKRGPESIKKKKLLADPESINKRIKILGSEEKKKIMDESKVVVASGNKVPQRSQHGNARGSNPTILVMKFPAGAALPSGPQLRAKFARYGTLDLDATRVFWKTYTCRLVYLRKADAEEALEFAVGSNNLFGSTNVRCYIREVGVEAVKRESAFENNSSSSRPVAKTGVLAQSLKSCLKKPPCIDEGGNGNGRGTRVKFVLGGEGSSSKTQEQVSSFPVVVSESRNNEHLTDATTTTTTTTSIKILPKFSRSSLAITTAHRFQKNPINAELLPRSFNVRPPTATKDISQQLLNLLTRCSDLVNNVTGVLGYMPYHAL